MRHLRKRWVLVLLVPLVLGPIGWYGAHVTTATASEAGVVAKVKQGDFKVTVTTTGELRAREFVQIQGPPNAQQANVYQTKIASILPEGQRVKAGEVVAELDRSPAATGSPTSRWRFKRPKRSTCRRTST